MKVLIANFDFPPNQGIGGRRWAKLAKGLAARGVEVFVIKADPVSNNVPSPWTSDVDSPLIHIHSLPRTYPESVSHPKSGVIAKLRYIADMRGLRRYSEGTIYDVAIGWEERFKNAAAEIIRSQGITHLVATGAPFNLLYYSAKLRDEFPGIRILADYRDPWLTARNYGMPGLSEDKMQHERRKQQTVFDLCDVITAPYPSLLQTMRHEDARAEAHASRFHVLPHFYDADDIPEGDAERDSYRMVMVYAGAIYQDTQPAWDALYEACAAMPEADREKLEIRIFTDSSLPDFKIFNLSCIKVSRGIGKRVFAEIRRADLCLLMMAGHNRNFLTTKIMEYLPLRRPFLYLGPKGEVSEFIRSNRLGYCPDNLAAEWNLIREELGTGTPSLDRNYDISVHELGVATGELLKLLR